MKHFSQLACFWEYCWEPILPSKDLKIPTVCQSLCLWERAKLLKETPIPTHIPGRRIGIRRKTYFVNHILLLGSFKSSQKKNMNNVLLLPLKIKFWKKHSQNNKTINPSICIVCVAFACVWCRDLKACLFLSNCYKIASNYARIGRVSTVFWRSNCSLHSHHMDHWYVFWSDRNISCSGILINKL